jgi:hypothetical protein
MYTLLLDESNKLVTTVRERIMQRSKLVDDLHFLVDPIYKGYNMEDFMVTMEYLLPVSREYKTEILVKSDELYKDKLEYKLPFDTNLTREAGDVEVQLTFTSVTVDDCGKSIQRVRKTSTAVITIVPISAWSDIIADSALTALDQRLIQTQAMLEAVNEMNMYIADTKADNIHYDEEGQYIQLTANGNPIGDKIVLNISDEKVCVQYVKVNENGELIITYSNGTTENAGKVVEDFVSGIYIPDVSKDGMLTMTLSQTVGEPSYTWDIDPSNNWNEIEGVERDTNYFWEEL